MLRVIAGIIASYLLGGVLFGHIMAGMVNADLKQKGSGNPGATNVFRVIGPFAGVLVLVGDVVKGIAAVALGNLIGGNPAYLPLYGLAAIIGHNWSIYHRFQGGKGMSTTLGAVIMLCPKVLWIVLPGWLGGIVALSYVSFGAVMAAVTLPIATLVFYPGQKLMMVFSILASAMAIYRHIPNIKRMLKGEEHKVRGLFRRKESGS